MWFVLVLFAINVLVTSQTVTTTGNVETAATISQIPSSLPSPDPGWRHNRTRQAKHIHDFFKAFGWLRHNETIHDGELPAAIRKIQRVLHEPQTGQYDERMEKVMSQPRCGAVQQYNATDAALTDKDIQARYVLWGPKWDHAAITYRFINYTADLPADKQRSIVSNSFARWAQYLPLTVSPTQSNEDRTDINIQFIRMGADDAYAITNLVADGLAITSGSINITFNDDYDWSDDRLFNYSSTHEIGHSFGLSHSKLETAIMWPYYEGFIKTVTPDDEAAVHSLYGWKNPRWARIDDNTGGSNSIVQLSSNSTTPSALDGLYQLRANGQVLLYTSSGSWTSVDNNKDTAQIAGAAGTLYQRHYDGSVYRYTGSSSNWQYIGAASDNVIDIVAAADQIYQRRKDGWVARWSGIGTTWTAIENPLTSKQIAVTDSKTLWNLLMTGDLVRSSWPYGSGWTIVDQNPANVAIATGGDEFYKLQSDGQVVWLDSQAVYWVVIEDAGATAVYAAGSFVYSRHADGSIWRYTGTPLVWEQLDGDETSVAVVGDARGQVWELLGNGDVLRLVS